MSNVIGNNSLIKVKSIVFEALPVLILIVLDKEKLTNPRKPMLAAYRIVEAITNDYFNCFEQIKPDKEVGFRDIEKLLRPRIYDIMQDLVELDLKEHRTDDNNNDPPKCLGYVKRINMEYEITEKGKEALKEYICLLGNFITPYSAAISNIGEN